MKIIKNTAIMLFLLPLFTFSGCFDGTSDTEVEEVETQGNYSISIPSNWEIFPKSEYEKNMIFAAREAEYSSIIPTTITISQVHSLPPSLNTLIKKNYEIVRRESQDFKIVSEEDFTTEETEKDQDENNDENKENKIQINQNETREPKSRLVIYTEKYTGTNSFALIYSLNVLSYKERKTYVINILTDLNSSDEEKERILNILKSFTITL